MSMTTKVPRLVKFGKYHHKFGLLIPVLVQKRQALLKISLLHMKHRSMRHVPHERSSVIHMESLNAISKNGKPYISFPAINHFSSANYNTD